MALDIEWNFGFESSLASVYPPCMVPVVAKLFPERTESLPRVGVLGILQSQVVPPLCSGNEQLLAMVRRVDRKVKGIFPHSEKEHPPFICEQLSNSGRLELLGRELSGSLQ